jgi:hypothetical protein
MTLFIESYVASAKPRTRRRYWNMSRHDLPRIEAFFLSFDFDQRRSYFGGGISDDSILSYCRAIDWSITDIVGRSGVYCLESLALVVALDPDLTKAELSVACPLVCDQRKIIAELVSIAIELAKQKYLTLVVRRELAHPNLIEELRRERFTFGSEEIEIALAGP